MPLVVCKQCGSQNGFYSKDKVRGSAETHYNANGDFKNNQADMYNDLIHTQGKTAYCVDCNARVGRIENIVSGKIEDDY